MLACIPRVRVCRDPGVGKTSMLSAVARKNPLYADGDEFIADRAEFTAEVSSCMGAALIEKRLGPAAGCEGGCFRDYLISLINYVMRDKMGSKSEKMSGVTRSESVQNGA